MQAECKLLQADAGRSQVTIDNWLLLLLVSQAYARRDAV